MLGMRKLKYERGIARCNYYDDDDDDNDNNNNNNNNNNNVNAFLTCTFTRSALVCARPTIGGR